jgi:hypothetical protein
MEDLLFHEAANLFPLMAPDELDALAEDIKKQGQREAIYTYPRPSPESHHAHGPAHHAADRGQ